jgi:proline iminopeptidase
MKAPLEFIRRQWLSVSGGHRLHLAEYGTLGSPAVLYLHGGPGAGCSANDLALFDGLDCHLIMLDQRGAGRSEPHGSLKENTFAALINDIETLRQGLNLESWCLAGGSFGATLGLVYSHLYPQRVKSQVLWGLFTPSVTALDWLYGPNGAAALFPTEYRQLVNGLPAHLLSCSTSNLTYLARDQLLAAFEQALKHPSCQIKVQASSAWLNWEQALALPGHGVCSRLIDGEDMGDFSLALIELNFAINHYFNLETLFAEALRQPKVLTWLIQGELDWVCPWDVLRPQLVLEDQSLIAFKLLPGAYHSLGDPKMRQGVIDAIEQMLAI